MTPARLALPVLALLALASCATLRDLGVGRGQRVLVGTVEWLRPHGLLLRTDENELVSVDLFPDPRLGRPLFLGERVRVYGYPTQRHQFYGRAVQPDGLTAGR
jgi:hypothetical protein